MKNKIFALALLIVLIVSGCSKEKRYTRKIKGVYNLTLSSKTEHTGVCGASGVIDETEIINAGTFDFTGEFAYESVLNEFYKGVYTVDYIITNDFGSYPVQDSYTLYYSFQGGAKTLGGDDLVSDYIIFENEDKFIYDLYDIVEIDKKRLVIESSEGGGPADCYRTTNQQIFEKD